MGLENPLHIAFVLILALLVFGAKRLPEMGRSLGDGMRGFRDALAGQAGPAPVHESEPRTAAQVASATLPAPAAAQDAAPATERRAAA
ncbi:MAG TPA: twin-arginine translocase TatA/TatE family subunit [Solirubrobacteraceae bacterium]|nr:twin-arginine translocase TatA/TatE family subunit [Solirubrobacteraceae bacterium]